MSLRNGLGSIGYAADRPINAAIKKRISMEGFIRGQGCVLYLLNACLRYFVSGATLKISVHVPAIECCCLRFVTTQDATF